MNKIIIITGGSASGKTFLANKLKKILGRRAVYISQDSFYRASPNADQNFDEPSAFDFKMQNLVINELLQNKETNLPIYDFVKKDVVGYEKTKPSEFILFEGLFTFYDRDLYKKADFKIFVDTPSDMRLSRRILRDTKERGRDIEGVISRWIKDVKPSYKKYIAGMKSVSDVVIPWEKINEKSLKSIISSVVNLDKRIEDIVNNNY